VRRHRKGRDTCPSIIRRRRRRMMEMSKSRMRGRKTKMGSTRRSAIISIIRILVIMGIWT
jgi:hypothetical protein